MSKNEILETLKGCLDHIESAVAAGLIKDAIDWLENQ